MKLELDKTAWSMFEDGYDLQEKKKFSSAFKLYLKAAMLGVPEAQISVANYYEDGVGVRSDAVLSVYWYKKAVASGLHEAAYNLALHHKNRGARRWYRYWLERAANMGDKDAAKELKRELSEKVVR
ncbi:SEL1-like repeat protein [Lysobacter sp. Root916]|uniref:tetratricopeptide repeat protein n=1 Tax=Lysobacter sp. Root916 TaxID=1736606 RepID=UPI0009E8EF6B|nr:SEL1-like repeat protein [Lysobacter sp. Root916]